MPCASRVPNEAPSSCLSDKESPTPTHNTTRPAAVCLLTINEVAFNACHCFGWVTMRVLGEWQLFVMVVGRPKNCVRRLCSSPMSSWAAELNSCAVKYDLVLKPRHYNPNQYFICLFEKCRSAEAANEDDGGVAGSKDGSKGTSQ